MKQSPNPTNRSGTRGSRWRKAAVGVVLSLGLSAIAATPASAADTAIKYLANTASVQSVNADVSFVDSKGATFTVKVETTWQRLSSSKATLRTIIVRAGTFPRGDCLQISVGSTTNINYFAGAYSLCPGGYRSFAVNKTVTTYGANTLGQITVSTPDPWNPYGAGARWMYVEYHT